jgi:CRISPR/Cas system CMR subunit Cmr6 (Cas7 group RAMP superfamily)
MAGRIENLKPQNMRTKAEQRKIAQQGGKASVKARREKKLMSAILADYLARQKGYDSFDKYIEKVLKRGNAATVNMIKTFADVIEGSKVKTETVLTINTDDEKVAAVLAEYGITKPESKD